MAETAALALEQILTGTLGSDTAMLSGYTDTFTHWLREAAKRYGSSARSHRLRWEQLGGKRDRKM